MTEIRASVVGMGFVGGTLAKCLTTAGVKVKSFDKLKPKLGTDKSLTGLVTWSDVIFVCVPTPMKKDGSCDTSIVESVVGEIAKIAKKEEVILKPTVVIRSTVAPGTTRRLHDKFSPTIAVVFNPEFLREAHAEDDFRNQDRIVLGTANYDDVKNVKEVYKLACPKVPVVTLRPESAEMVKYVTNGFLATKVSFANEIKQLCDKLKIDYSQMIKVAQLDRRLGESHWQVPGPDGCLGSGGHCLPKDLNELISIMSSLGVKPTVSKATWEKNLEVRKEADRDWEKMVGRAVSIDESSGDGS